MTSRTTRFTDTTHSFECTYDERARTVVAFDLSTRETVAVSTPSIVIAMLLQIEESRLLRKWYAERLVDADFAAELYQFAPTLLPEPHEETWLRTGYLRSDRGVNVRAGKTIVDCEVSVDTSTRLLFSADKHTEQTGWGVPNLTLADPGEHDFWAALIRATRAEMEAKTRLSLATIRINPSGI